MQPPPRANRKTEAPRRKTHKYMQRVRGMCRGDVVTVAFTAGPAFEWPPRSFTKSIRPLRGAHHAITRLILICGLALYHPSAALPQSLDTMPEALRRLFE